MTIATWLQHHQAAGAVIAGAALLVLLAAAWAVRRRSVARVLRAITLPGVLAWEAEGLYRLGLDRIHAPVSMALILAGITSATLLTFAAFADEHYRRHEALGPSGRRMWWVAAPMGVIVALNSASAAEAALRIILPLLSVLIWRAAYLPDEPQGAKAKPGQSRLAPRRIAAAIGLIDPSDDDLPAIARERLTRRLVTHALGTESGPRWLRDLHRRRFARAVRVADDAMLAEVASRTRRVREGLSRCLPGTPRPAVPGASPAAAPGHDPEHAPEQPAGHAAAVNGTPTRAARRASSGPALRLPASRSRTMTPADLVPHVRAMADRHGTAAVTVVRVKKDLSVGTDKARQAIALAAGDQDGDGPGDGTVTALAPVRQAS